MAGSRWGMRVNQWLKLTGDTEEFRWVLRTFGWIISHLDPATLKRSFFDKMCFGGKIFRHLGSSTQQFNFKIICCIRPTTTEWTHGEPMVNRQPGYCRWICSEYSRERVSIFFSVNFRQTRTQSLLFARRVSQSLKGWTRSTWSSEQECACSISNYAFSRVTLQQHTTTQSVHNFRRVC